MTLPRWMGDYQAQALAFLVSLALFLLSFLFLEQGPGLESMNPRIGNPGETITLGGQYFGYGESRGWITIGGERLDDSLVKSWKSGEIVFTLPKDVSSGPVVVNTSNGKSRSLLFTNRNHIPSILSPRQNGNGAWMASVSAPSWVPGMPCTLRGGSFGDEPGDYWLQVGSTQIQGVDILSWSEDTIVFILPPREGKANVTLVSPRGQASSIVLPEAPSTWIARDKAVYQVKLGAEIGEVELGGQGSGGLISAYLPRPASVPNQVVGNTQAKGGLVDQDAWVFVVDNPQADMTRTFEVTMTVERMLFDPAGPADPGIDFPSMTSYAGLLAGSRLVPAGHDAVKNFVRSVLPGPVSPFQKLVQLFTAVTDRLEPDPDAGFGYGTDVLGDRKASSFGYADLLVASLRQAGVPAVLVEGVLVAGQEANQHFWLQALIPGLGWVEIDPYEAEFMLRRQQDLKPADVMLKSAGLDHIALGRGETDGSLTRMDAEIRKSFQRNVLLGIIGESSGNVSSYGIFLPLVQARKTGP